MTLVTLMLLFACRNDQAVDSDPLGEDTGPFDLDGDGYVGGEDCDDDDPDVHPEATEVCNGIDDDCDQLIDDDDDSLDATTGTESWTDGDTDGYGDPDLGVQTCVVPSGNVQNADDCDDTRDHVHPDAEELCDGLDNDCDDALPEDEGDTDGDGLLDCEDPIQGTALEFEAGDVVVLPGSEALHLQGAHTLEAWFKTTGELSNENAVLGKHVGGYYNSWFLGFNSYYGTSYAAQYYIGGPRMTGSVSLNDGAWHHIAGSYDGSTAILYVDGTEISRASYSPGSTNSLLVTIGGHGSAGGSFQGLLDEVRIWSVARTAEQISGSMNGPLTGSEEGLVAYYDFNGGSGQEATDRSPNGWTAQLGLTAEVEDDDPTWADDSPFAE